MAKNKHLAEFFAEQERVLERAAGKPYRAIRDMISVLREATHQTSAALGSESTELRLHVTPDPSVIQRLRASWERIPEDARICLIDAIQRNVHQLVRHQLLPVIANDAGILLIETRPQETLAPLSARMSVALQAAVDVVRVATECSSLSVMADVLNSQEFMTTIEPNDCIPAFQVLTREFPGLVPQVRSVYDTWMCAAADLFATLREAEKQLQTHEEYVRFLVELHEIVWNSMDQRCGKGCPSLGLKTLCIQSILSSLTQALTLSRTIGASHADRLFPMMPEHVRSHAEIAPAAHAELEERYRCAQRMWAEEIDVWRGTVESVKGRMQEHPVHILHGSSLIQSLEDAASGMCWLNRLWRETDMTIVARSAPVSNRGVSFHDSERPLPRFSAIILSRPVFRNGDDVADVRMTRSGTTIARRVEYDPCSLPEISVYQHSGDAAGAPLHCWMCSPENGVSPAGGIVPFATICAGNENAAIVRLRIFAESLERSCRDSTANLASDPFLASHFREVRASDQFLLAVQDPDCYAVLAPGILASGCLAGAAIRDTNVQEAVAALCAAESQIPGPRAVPEDPMLVSWTVNLDVQESEEGEADDRDHAQREHIREYLQSKKRWSADEVNQLFKVAGIEVQSKKKHWKIGGPRGSFPLPSAPLKDGEWRANFVVDMILKCGDLDAFERWVRELHSGS